jgi:hypothetical protein
MGLDDIFTIFVILIIVVSFIKNAFLKKSDPSKKQSGLGKMISDIITQIREENAEVQTNAEHQTAGTGWESSRGYEDETDYDVELKSVKRVPKEIKKETGLSSIKRKQELIKQMQMNGKLARPVAGGQRRTSQAEPSTGGSMELSVRNLHNAIIWSEILSPPVALRKDREP